MFNNSRRQFLENSMLTAAAAAVAGVSPRVAPAQEKESPNETIRAAVIGVNGRGGSHISGLKGQPNVDVVAICDVDEAVGMKRVEALKKSVGHDVKFYQDLRKLFEDDSIDVVSIATPNHWHALAAIWAIQAGKDVYVEKPVSHNVSEGRRIVQAARKYKKICQTGTQCRSMQGTKDAIQHVHDGGIGDLKIARGLCYKRRKSIGAVGNYDVPASVDYNIWLGPAQDKPLSRGRFHYDWHWQWDYGNGDLGNQGIHQMDLARWGLDTTDIGEGVFSYGGRLGYEDAGETANTQVVNIDYGDRMLVFEVRGLETKDYRTAKVGVIFEGTEGYVALNSYTGGVAFDPDGNKTKEFKGGGDHFANFIAAVRSRKMEDLNADIEQGHLSSAMCHLGNISYRLGKSMTVPDAKASLPEGDEYADTFERTLAHLKDNNVDPKELMVGPDLRIDAKNETFVGSGELIAQANTMLTREYREPFVVPAEADL